MAPQKVNCTVCSRSSVSDAPPTGGVQTSRQGRFHTLSPGWSPSEKTGSGLQHHHQCPLMLVGQSLRAHSRPQHFAMVQCTAYLSSCTLQWNGALLGLACSSSWQSCTVAVVFSSKGITFCTTLQLASGRLTLCLLMVLSLSPAIGPTLGTNFVVMGFKPPLQMGGPSSAGPTAVYRDKQVDLMVIADLLHWT